MLPESFGGRIIYLLQQYGPSFAKGAGVSMWLALVGTLFGCIIGFLVGIVQTIPVDKNDSTAKKGTDQNREIYPCLLCGVLPWNSYDGTGNVYLLR